MKLKTYFNAALLCLAAGLFAACAGDELTSDNNKGRTNGLPQGVHFAINELKLKAQSRAVITENGTAAAKTRTIIKHTLGQGAEAYWSEGDRIFVKNKNGDWKRSIATSLLDGGTRALFILPGNEDDYADNCAVAYADFDENSSEGYRAIDGIISGSTGYMPAVEIKTNQDQTTPNDFSKAGKWGDCGVGTGKKQGGKFEFTLEHSPSYLCLLPRCENAGLGTNIELTNIMIYATSASNNSITSTMFELHEDGTIDYPLGTPSSYGSPSNVVMGTVNNFPLTNTATNPETNACYFVVYPSTYDCDITYTIKDKVTGVEAQIKKQVNGVVCKAGEVTDITSNLNVTRTYTNKYYAWDADEPYDIGRGYEASLPTIPYGKVGATYLPLSFFPVETRTYDADQAPYDKRLGHGYWPGANSDVTAQTNFFKNNTPNVNEALWYAFKGDPHWDNTTPWLLHNHLYTGGMWLKTKSKICADEGITASYMENGYKADIGPYAGTYNTYQDYSYDGSAPTFDNTAASINTPLTNTAGYFFLPALGYYGTVGSDYNKVWLTDVGVTGGYWTPNSSLWETGMISFNIESGKVSVNMQDNPIIPRSVVKFQ